MIGSGTNTRLSTRHGAHRSLPSITALTHCSLAKVSRHAKLFSLEQHTRTSIINFLIKMKFLTGLSIVLATAIGMSGSAEAVAAPEPAVPSIISDATVGGARRESGYGLRRVCAPLNAPLMPAHSRSSNRSHRHGSLRRVSPFLGRALLQIARPLPLPTRTTMHGTSQDRTG